MRAQQHALELDRRIFSCLLYFSLALNATHRRRRKPHSHSTQNPTTTMASSSTNGTTTTFYQTDKNLMKLCDFLRSSDGPAVREAIEMDKRVYYIKGTFM
eukprot:scaffold16889_cov63-Cyclotella_meneghiniana.AAC.3